MHLQSISAMRPRFPHGIPLMGLQHGSWKSVRNLILFCVFWLPATGREPEPSVSGAKADPGTPSSSLSAQVIDLPVSTTVDTVSATAGTPSSATGLPFTDWLSRRPGTGPSLVKPTVLLDPARLVMRTQQDRRAAAVGITTRSPATLGIPMPAGEARCGSAGGRRLPTLFDGGNWVVEDRGIHRWHSEPLTPSDFATANRIGAEYNPDFLEWQSMDALGRGCSFRRRGRSR